MSERKGQDKNTRIPGLGLQALSFNWFFGGGEVGLHVFLLLPFSNLSLGKEETEDMPTVGKPTSSSPPNTN